MSLVALLVIAGLVFVNGFFVAAEFALVKVRTTQIDQLAEQGNWAAKLTGRALDRLETYLSASQLGITVASLALGKAISSSIEEPMQAFFKSHHIPDPTWVVGGLELTLVGGIALSIVTFLHMALGEQAPKSLAIRMARPVALITAPVLVAFYYLFWPVIWALNKASNLTLWAIGLGQTDHAAVSHTEEELKHIVAESVAGGHLSRSERMMIENVLNLEEKTARRIMVPRPDIVYMSLSRTLDENLRIARQTGHTRFPLCEDDLTTVIGMIHVKDLFRTAGANHGRPDLRKLIRKLPFLPDNLHLDALLVQFQRNQVHLAMLLDEYGSVVGMASLENVLEELVGPIQDEFDHETPMILPLSEGVFEVDASCPLDVMAGTCGIEQLPETDAETAGGLILDELGRFAQVGDSITIDRHRLTVLKAEPNRIRRIRVEPEPNATAGNPDS